MDNRYSSVIMTTMLPIQSEFDHQREDAADPAAVRRFLAAGTVDHPAWRDGTGYPLDALAPMNAATRELLVSRLEVSGWREVEVLAAIGTPSARAALRATYDAAGSARMQIGTAALRWMPEIVSESERTELVSRAIKQARGGYDLDVALEAAQAWHPAAVMRALWWALEHHADDVVVVHVAALLHYVHGLADAPFDPAQRGEFLRFAADDPGERAAALERLKARVPGSEIHEQEP
jgi:hypothetical protein